MKLCRWMLLGASLFAVVPARGFEPIKIAVPDVRSSGKVDAELVEPLSALLASEISKREGVSVLSSADIRTMLGFEAQQQLLGCSEDSSCLAEIGGALGVDLLVSSEAARLGESYFVTVVVLDTATATGVGRATGEAMGEGELVSALRLAIEQAIDPALAKRRGLSPGPFTIEPRSPGGVGPIPGGTPSARRRGGLFWTGLGLGIATLGTGAALLADGNVAHSRWVTDPADISWAQAQRAKTEANVGGVLLGVGAAVGIGAFLLPRSGGHPAMVTVLPTPDGVWLGLQVGINP